MLKIKKVVIGLSGGVDSAVAAKLLKNRGYEVTGVFIKNWDERDENGVCTIEQDYKDAEIISNHLEIPFIHVNFIKDYWNYVFREFLDDYQNGLTPNPDILCNRYIKYGKFYNFARENLEADAVATGHYAQTSFGNFLEHYEADKDVQLLTAFDKFKDQTFFLSKIKQEALRKWMFPIGAYSKNEVKLIAKQIGLSHIAAKKESTGICFIGKRDFKKFMNQYLYANPGYFVDIDDGKIVGKHNGFHEWTIGQRCRISGCLKPYFTVRKDLTTNNIFVAMGSNHSALYVQQFYTDKPYWIRSNSTENFGTLLQFRFQHTKPLVNCIISEENDILKVILDKPLRAITPGQYAVFYLKNECLGSARILSDQKYNFNYGKVIKNEN